MNETKTIYFDCSGGLTAHLIVGAVCDLGVPPSALEWELGQVDLGAYHLHFDRSEAAGQPGVAFWFHAGEHHHDEQEHHHHDEHEHGGECGHEHHEHGDRHDHHEHGEGCCGHDHEHDHGDGHSHAHAHVSEEAGFKVGDAREMVEGSELGDSAKARASSILQRLAGVRDEISKGDLAALICACAGIEQLRAGRVAFFARQTDGRREDALGGAIAAEFVTSTCAMPAVKEEKMGRGLDRTGRIVRAVVGTEA